MTKSKRSILNVEALEARQLLATSVTQPDSHIVSIRGNEGVDLVFIEQNDDLNQLIIRTNTQRFQNGQRMETFVFNSDEIRRLDIRLGDGNDRVEFKQVGNLFNRKTFNVNLGAGDDQANFDFGLGYVNENPVTTQEVPVFVPGYFGPSPDGSQDRWNDGYWTTEIRTQATEPTVLAPVRVQLQGGSGEDNVNLNLGSVASTSVEYRLFLDSGNDTSSLNLFGTVLAGSDVDLRMHGGSGSDYMTTNSAATSNLMAGANMMVLSYGQEGTDELSLNYLGLVDGTLRLDSEGGQGNDQVGHVVTLAAASTGTVDSAVYGNSGDDVLVHVIDQEVDPLEPGPVATANLLALLDGGSGDDEGTTTVAVGVLNLETHILV